MNAIRQIAVIAPKQMISAFSVLIDSTPNQRLLASAANLDDLLTVIGAGKPDVVLIYLVRENGLDTGKSTYEVITQIKKNWPESLCVTIVKYTSQLDQAKENGADLALVDGVNAQRLLAAIDGKVT